MSSLSFVVGVGVMNSLVFGGNCGGFVWAAEKEVTKSDSPCT